MAAIDIVLPVHNEELTIGDVISEFFSVLALEHGLDIRLVVSEDGSRDRTRDVVGELAETHPIKLLPESARKGYSKAVIDGLRATDAPIVVFSDSDGQCDPRDIPRLLEALAHCDVVVGYRNPRVDSRFRRVISSAFGMLYHKMFAVPLHDPSCPVVAIRRDAVSKVIVGNPGILPFGFWWEFNARAAAARLRVTEAPVNHRSRANGRTSVYRLGALPRIAIEHLRGLLALRRELKGAAY